MKLVKLLSEMKVNKPLSDKDIFDLVTKGDEDGHSLIENFSTFNNFEEYSRDYGESPDTEEGKIAQLYFSRVHNKIQCFTVEDTGGENNMVLKSSFKYCKWFGMGYNNAFIILHNYHETN
jgi:hypothetical protein